MQHIRRLFPGDFHHMVRSVVWILFATAAAIASGCFNLRTTALPTPLVHHPQTERKSYERHDPFPAQDLGPATQTRPRGFGAPRNAARQAAEQRILKGLPSHSSAPSPGSPRSPTQYPQAVQP